MTPTGPTSLVFGWPDARFPCWSWAAQFGHHVFAQMPGYYVCRLCGAQMGMTTTAGGAAMSASTVKP